MKLETFNAACYSVAAQVIPVLIFAAAASKWWRKQPDDPWHVNTMLVGVVLIALTGEAFAMKALQFERDASAFEDNVIGMAFGLPVVYVFLALAEDQVKVMLQQAPPALHRWGRFFLGPPHSRRNRRDYELRPRPHPLFRHSWVSPLYWPALGRDRGMVA